MNLLLHMIVKNFIWQTMDNSLNFSKSLSIGTETSNVIIIFGRIIQLLIFVGVA